jgi:hypothetical protein
MANAKGTVMIGAAKVLRTMKVEAQKVLPERFHHYLSERVSPAAWYPEEDALALIQALVQLMPGDRDQILETFGTITAKELGGGIYSHLVEDGGSESSTYALWSSMHDTGELSVDFEEGHAMTFQLTGYAHPSAEMCAIIGSYIQETVRMGGRNAHVEKTGCTFSGDRSCRWRASW